MEQTDKKYLSGLRKKAENKVKLKNKVSDENQISELEHELNVHEIELSMQNEELLKTQSKLKNALKEFEELFELSPVGYFILDKDGIIKNVNKRGCEKLANVKSEIVGEYFSNFISGEANQDDFYRHRNLVMKTESLQKVGCEIKKGDKNTFSAQITSTVIKDENLKFKHLLSMVSDISEIKKHEHQVELALAKAEELNEMKSKFITMASHEFRTPLTIMLSSISIIEQFKELLPQENRIEKHLNRIKSSINDLTIILDEFLSLEKIETGIIEIKKENFNLPESCEDFLDGFRLLIKKNQTINYIHIGNKVINHDFKIIQFILLNLLSNASKYSIEGTEIDMFTEVSKNKVLIKVKDNGIGISKSEQKNLFTRFFRAQNALHIPGTGLGLIIVKRYLDLIGGTIEINSNINKGTTVTIQFPINNNTL
ncbi:PAS domain-containing sensor histidine kinase [Pedobacter cryophilus]|uniref:histidine kinase n=1 Tax=Pedobacter cryophilus TaxID=2571271 RepID=A0A4U1BTX2_9SPHI|nr:PAS domain-containing sensor histidine kinase [Pedobacter cryophilus]TKB96059.1 PAS domain-containing sensor histidine kinase [Pedobacter cryophilus]